MKWSKLKALVEAEIEKCSLGDPFVSNVEIYYEDTKDVTYRIIRIDLQDKCELYEILDKRPE
jgi:hypothetical protein